MIPNPLYTLITGLFILLSLTIPPHAFCSDFSNDADTLVIKDITIIDGTESKPKTNTTIIIQNEKIIKINPDSKPVNSQGSRVINGQGLFLIPGLFDVHAHVTFLRNPRNFSGYDRQTSEQVLKILLAHGITTIRNPGAPSIASLKFKDDVKAKSILGPDIFTAGEIINFGKSKNENDIRKEVSRQAVLGVDYIKLYSRVRPELLKAAVEEAHKYDIKVIGHLGNTTPTIAALSGIDGISHGVSWSVDLLPEPKREQYKRQRRHKGYMLARLDWLDWLDINGPEINEMIHTIALKEIPIAPTLIAYATKFFGNSPTYINRPELKLTPKPILESWKNALPNWKEKDFQRSKMLWQKMLDLIKKYHDSGILLMAGSDLPNPWVIPGVSLHDELELLVNAGISPHEVIQIATKNSAEGLGILSDVGTIETGKNANLLILGGNPLTNIKNTRDIRYIILNGEIYTPSALLGQ